MRRSKSLSPGLGETIRFFSGGVDHYSFTVKCDWDDGLSSVCRSNSNASATTRFKEVRFGQRQSRSCSTDTLRICQTEFFWRHCLVDAAVVTTSFPKSSWNLLAGLFSPGKSAVFLKPRTWRRWAFCGLLFSSGEEVPPDYFFAAASHAV